MAPLLLIAAGGTGGHMFPAQALAETMLARGWRVRLSTDARGARYAGGFPAEVEVERVASATPARGGALARLAVPLRIAQGVATATARMRRDPPAVVAGFGGYPTIPALAAAGLLRLPRLIHEQNGVPGRVNLAFARRVDRVACGMWPTALPAGVQAVHSGNPVRAAVRAAAGAPYVAPGAEGPLSVLAIGGSQGARALSDLLPEAVAALPGELRARLRLAQQVRAEDHARVAARYAELGLTAELAPFFEDVPARMAGAQLVISRAGASSIADLAAIGRPAILIPYPAATGDHQSANARTLADVGGAVLMPEAGLAPKALSMQMGAILTDPGTARGMARAASAAGRLDAAEALAGLVEELAGRGKGARAQ